MMQPEPEHAGLQPKASTQKAQSPGATGQSAEKKPDTQIVGPTEKIGKSNLIGAAEFRDLRDRFAKRRYDLQRVYRADDGRVSFHIMRRSKTCVLTHPHDVRAFLAVVEGAAL